MTSLITIRTDMTVDLVQFVGGDATVIAAARVSTKAEASRADLERSPRESAGLINYLVKSRHGSPLEHNLFTFYIEAPIFVFREFHRHRIGWSYNETSGRYRELSPVFYVPDAFRPLVQVGKPGHYTFEQGATEQYHSTTAVLADSYAASYLHYQQLLEQGIAKEVARACLPVGIYSSMYATCNARALMHFLGLRTSRENATFPSYPQWEIEMVANEMEDFFKDKMPMTWEAFNENGRVSP